MNVKIITCPECDGIKENKECSSCKGKGTVEALIPKTVPIPRRANGKVQ